ncbi:HpcH/HpaI aldolase/citrate lyase family protein [Lichenicoccus sp.]|uniref:HpcH/HpaI aldolase/citrate lyase family protein n=1 Tax=Lichenicoccus sp. TaxID=2781899 RepID=UPI003D0B317E
MILRSLLFVPADRPERIDKALASGADAVILDLEDSVTSERKALARETVAAVLARPDRQVAIFVRINPLDSAHAMRDLDAAAPGRPDGIVLPKAEGARSLIDLNAGLSARGDGSARILPIATETPAAMFRLGEYAGVTDRLVGLTWGAEDLPAAIGAATAREPDGSYTPPYQLARSLTLFAAAAAEVAPIETVFPDFRDLPALSAYASRAARDGFTGMLAIHPSQIAAIHTAFTPSPSAIENAQAVVDAFAANPGAGAIALNDRMLDAPHLRQARRILARCAAV